MKERSHTIYEDYADILDDERFFNDEENLKKELADRDNKLIPEFVCINCYESVTDPVCGHCFLNQIKLWLRDLDIDPVAKDVIINTIKKGNSIDSINATECIICDQQNVSICAYCFFLKSYRILLELNFPKEKVEEFLETFNYRFVGGDYDSDHHPLFVTID